MRGLDEEIRTHQRPSLTTDNKWPHRDFPRQLSTRHLQPEPIATGLGKGTSLTYSSYHCCPKQALKEFRRSAELFFLILDLDRLLFSILVHFVSAL